VTSFVRVRVVTFPAVDPQVAVEGLLLGELAAADVAVVLGASLILVRLHVAAQVPVSLEAASADRAPEPGKGGREQVNARARVRSRSNTRGHRLLRATNEM